MRKEELVTWRVSSFIYCSLVGEVTFQSEVGAILVGVGKKRL